MLASFHEVFFLFSLPPIVFTYLMEQEKTQFHSDCFIKSHSYQQSSEMTTVQWLDWYFEGLIISTGYMYRYLPVLNGEKTQYCSEAGKWGYLFGLKDSRLNWVLPVDSYMIQQITGATLLVTLNFTFSGCFSSPSLLSTASVLESVLTHLDPQIPCSHGSHGFHL